MALLLPVPVWAHLGQIVAPHDLFSSWPAEPAVLVALVASASFYALGLRRIRLRAGHRQTWRRASHRFVAGWLVLAISLASPLHPLGSVLFSAHMTQHELLMVVAAPLLVLGRPLVPWLFALRPEHRRGVGLVTQRPWCALAWRSVSSLRVTWCLHAGAVLIWHLPLLYEMSIRSDVAHALQHISFFGTAILFWWAVLQPPAKRSSGAAAVGLFAMATLTGGLGALLALADAPWYEAYRAGTQQWGLTPLEDQQLAGLIMWMGGTISYLVAALVLVARMLSPFDRRSDARLSASQRSVRRRAELAAAGGQSRGG